MIHIDAATGHYVKMCGGCKRVLPVSTKYWTLNRTTDDGWHSICKLCKRDYDNAWAEANRHKRRAQQRRRYQQKRGGV